MTLDGLNIIVVGAGIGGLAVALALRQRGADVTLLEQSERIAEVGAGLQISPNGGAVLRALGLGEAIPRLGLRARAVCLRDYRHGKQVFRLNLDTAEEAPGYWFFHRADLIGLLASAARAAGVRVRLLQKVARLFPGSRPGLETASGAGLEADLVIGADGIHSVVRPALNGVAAPFFTRQAAWRAVVPNLTGHPPHARVHMGPGRHVVSYPLRGGRLVNLVAVREQAEWVEESWSHRDDPDVLRAAFADFCPEVHSLFGGLEEVGYWGLFRHPVARIWQRDGVALLGDAAHPTLPFLAQGANMALEDAWVLGRELAAARHKGEGLARYQMAREARVRRVVSTADGNAWKYHLGFPPLRLAAHLGMRLAGTVMPGRMQRQFDWLYLHDVTA
ncbi:FAD-dependent oxidoreductase [Aquicoccus sp. SCR17]|nr:FAD-dependent oxidoreductase [Carideicomes alvinocaridis]